MTKAGEMALRRQGDLETLMRRLQCGPQPRVRKSPNPLGGPQWMVDFERYGTWSPHTYGYHSWEGAVTAAVGIHKHQWELRREWLKT